MLLKTRTSGCANVQWCIDAMDCNEIEFTGSLVCYANFRSRCRVAWTLCMCALSLHVQRVLLCRQCIGACSEAARCGGDDNVEDDASNGFT